MHLAAFDVKFVTLYLSHVQNTALIISLRLQQRTCDTQGLLWDLKMKLDGGPCSARHGKTSPLKNNLIQRLSIIFA